MKRNWRWLMRAHQASVSWRALSRRVWALRSIAIIDVFPWNFTWNSYYLRSNLGNAIHFPLHHVTSHKQDKNQFIKHCQKLNSFDLIFFKRKQLSCVSALPIALPIVIQLRYVSNNYLYIFRQTFQIEVLIFVDKFDYKISRNPFFE